MSDSIPEAEGRQLWTTQRCRELLGEQAESMSDEEVDQLSDLIYQMADIVCSAIMRLKTEDPLHLHEETT